MSGDRVSGSTLVQVTAAEAARVNEIPAACIALIKKPRSDGSAHTIRVGKYDGKFALPVERVARGTGRECPITAVLKGKPSDEVVAAPRPLCLVSLELVECNTTNLPVPVKMRVELAPKKQAPFFAVARDIVVDPAKPFKRQSLLVEPLIYRDARHGFELSATDAWGFRDDDLMRNVARLLPDGCYLIPFHYRYSGLIARTHACIVLSNAVHNDNALYADTLPADAHMLPHTAEGFEIHGDALSAVVDFINNRLLASLTAFSPEKLSLVAMPFGVARWADVWAQYSVAAQNAVESKMAAETQKAIEFTFTLVAYFVELDAGESVDGVARVVE